MTSLLSLRRPSCVRVVASSNPDKPNGWKRFIAKRQATIKENLSRLAVIGMADVKDVYQALKDLDASHKKTLDNMNKTFKEKMDDEKKEETTDEPSSIFEPSNSE
jgi:hypothetical protein